METQTEQNSKMELDDLHDASLENEYAPSNNQQTARTNDKGQIIFGSGMITTHRSHRTNVDYQGETGNGKPNQTSFDSLDAGVIYDKT